MNIAASCMLYDDVNNDSTIVSKSLPQSEGQELNNESFNITNEPKDEFDITIEPKLAMDGNKD